MIRLQPATKLELRPTETMGFGVFANKSIKVGEVVEDCWTIDLPSGTDDILLDYKFGYPARTYPVDFFVALTGMGMMYNHSNTPNIIWNEHPSIQYCFRFTAVRDIQIGEQCFIYYGDDVQFP